tara:strand:+ start:967 stop:1797 length:831 start_codon:yes stop_codon:yes gene_type:complete
MKLLMKNWQSYLDKLVVLDEKLDDQFYITEVLGIQVPLNEAYPYSIELKEKIIKEHMLFEGFWGDLGDKIKQGTTAAWDKAKQLPKQVADMFIMLYKVFSGGKAKLMTFDKAVKRNGIYVITKKLNEFLDLIITKFSDQMESVANWAKKAKGLLGKQYTIQERALDWKSALKDTALLVGLKYIWSKIGPIIEDVLKAVDPNAQMALLKKFVKENMMSVFNNILNNLTSGIRAALGDITIFWDWLKEVGGGIKLVFDALSPVLAFFKGRGGLNETTI